MFDITAFCKPLDSKLRSTYIEQLSFSLLKHVFPVLSAKLELLDAPDLQAKDKSIGIEITEAITPQIAQINGEYTKLRFGKKSEHEKEKCKQLIIKNGGSLDSIGLSYPGTTSKDEWNLFVASLVKKLNLLSSYRATGFQKMGLFIFLNEPPIPFDPQAALSRFANIQNSYSERYDFLLLGYHFGIIAFDLLKMNFEAYPIDPDIFNSLSLHARQLVER